MNVDKQLISKALELKPQDRFYLIELLVRSLDKPDPEIDEIWLKEAEARLKAHTWTGNVRELRNIIERSVLVGTGPELLAEDLGLEIEAAALNAEADLPPEGLDLPAVLQMQERRYLEQALELTKGNEKKAARLLNLNYHTFRYRRRKLL